MLNLKRKWQSAIPEAGSENRAP